MSHRPAALATLLAAALAPLLGAPPAAAQVEVGVGADLVTRYVWRGYDFGDSFSAQPSLALTAGGLEVGVWASYAVSTADANEVDLYVSYTAGPITVGVTDYYFPSAPPDPDVTSRADVFNVRSGGEGAHSLEPFVSYSGGEALPLTITAATVAYNDPAFSTYVEAAYAFGVGRTTLEIAAGSVLALDPPDGTEGAPFYGTTRNAAVTNLALSASHEVPITAQFSLPVFGRYVVNPDTERAFVVFGVSL